MKGLGLIAASVILLCGCTSMGRVDSNVAAPANTESIFVFGVAPPNYRISVFPGSVQEERFHQNLFRPAAVYGGAKDGYVIGKGANGDTLAITNVRVVGDSSAILGPDFKPCGDAKTVVFQVPPHRVIYLGNLSYDFSGPKLTVNYWDDFEAARRYVDANYPALKDRLEQGSFQLLPVATGCSNAPIMIPIYIHR